MGVPNEKLVDVPVQQAGNIIMNNIHLGMVVLEQQVDYDALPLTALSSHQRKLDYLPCAAVEGTFTFAMQSMRCYLSQNLFYTLPSLIVQLLKHLRLQ